MKSPSIILGIETSCDETSVAVVRDGCQVLSCVIASSRKDFERMGGVIPEQAARRQLESILPAVMQALSDAEITKDDIDAIAVTHAPGLLGSLLIGTATARVLSRVWNVPLICVHHTLGHLSSTWLHGGQEGKESEERQKSDDLPIFPILTLSLSGGHSDLWLRTKHTKGKLIGTTRDDAAGEAFDKGAVLLGLPYPGGPALAKLADGGDEKLYTFPLPLSKERTMDFSFSGLKTSLKYLLAHLLEKHRKKDSIELSAKIRKNLAASYQRAICNHVLRSLRIAVEDHPEAKEIHAVGGVSANIRLQELLQSFGKQNRLCVRWPRSIRYCTDNGAMIAAAGYFLSREKKKSINEKFVTAATSALELHSS